MDTRLAFLQRVAQVVDKGGVADRDVGTTDLSMTLQRRFGVAQEVVLSGALPAHSGGLLIVAVYCSGAGQPTNPSTYMKVYVDGGLVHDSPDTDLTIVTSELTYGQTLYVGQIPPGDQMVEVKVKMSSYVHFCGFNARVLGAS